MKKLVCVSEVKAAADNGQKIFPVDSNTIITPAARDIANELGVELTVDAAAANKSCRPGEPRQQARRGEAFDRELIYQLVKAVLTGGIPAGAAASALEAPFHADCSLKSGFKIVRGPTVRLENFDTGKPGTNVAYREVIGKDESKMSAGFLTIENSSFDWELSYEEIDIVLDGSLSVTINGETYTAGQGDVLFVPKGSKVTWSSSGHVRLFYITYPANWPELVGQH